MTKSKILIIVLSIVLVAAVVTTVCLIPSPPDNGGNGGDNPPIKPQATAVSISVKGQKSAFDYGEDFSVGNLAVIATMSDNSTKALSPSEYTVDSSAYNKMQPSVYTINVSTTDKRLQTTYAVSVGSREILPVPTESNAVYAYNNMDPAFNNGVINYSDNWDTPDPTWEGRYKVTVAPLGEEERTQEVGMLAAFSALFSSKGGFSSYGMFDFNGSVVVRITTNFYFEQVDIRPLSLNIEYYRVEDMENTIEFVLTKPCNISVEFDGNLAKNLMLFSDSMKEYSKPSTQFVQDVKNNVTELDNLIVVEPGNINPTTLKEQYSDTKHNVIVFGAGLYFIQNVTPGGWGCGELAFPSNSTVYIHGDAAIYGVGRIVDANNVTVKGRGVFTGQTGGTNGVFRTSNSTNVTVQGITLNHSFSWSNATFASRGVVFRNVRICGNARNNNDGFDICNSSDILVDGCFIRTIDDCITIKGTFQGYARNYVENILVQNTVVWNYHGGNALAVGSESCSDVYNNIVYRDIDVIHNMTNRAIMMEQLDSAKVTNVVFDDIRMELESTFEFEDVHNYTSDWNNGAWLIMLKIMSNEEAFYGTDTNPGSIDGVMFNNIQFNGNSNRKIAIIGIDEEHDIRNIAFNNVSYNGTILTESNFNDYLDTGSSKYYSGLTFNGSTNSSYNEDMMIDDDDVQSNSMSAIRKVITEDENALNGSYTNYCVRYTNSFDLLFNVGDTGYTVPAIRIKQSLLGGVFEVAFDGKVVGLMNTYSENESYTEYFLPWQYLTEGEHKITLTAKHMPQEDFRTRTFDFNFDGIQLYSEGSNYIDFEKLDSSATIVKDVLATGGYAINTSVNSGESVVFKGYSERTLHAQWYLTYLAGPDKGIYKFYFGDNLVSTDIDMYAETSEYRMVALDTVLLPQGEYTITAKCIGKNALSSGTNCQLDNIYLRQFAVSKTYKGGYEGVYSTASASEGVNISRGQFAPIRFENMVNGSTAQVADANGMPNNGIYKHSIYLSNYDPSLFELRVDGKLVETTYNNGVLSFVYPRLILQRMDMEFKYIGSGTSAFSFEKLVIDPIEIDKSELRALIQSEDDKVFDATVEQYLIDNFYNVLVQAKVVLIDSLAEQSAVDIALEALQVAVSRIGESQARYNSATLSDSEVEVDFHNAQSGSLAILYLNDSQGQAVEYYAIVTEDGTATFTVDSTYVGQQVKLYAEVIGSPLAGVTIKQGDKIVDALDFIFANEYYSADDSEAFFFESLNETMKLIATFDANSVQSGEIAMISVRNSLNETLGNFYAQINADGQAIFNIAELVERSNIYVIVAVSLNDDAVVESLQADTAVVASANLTGVLAGTHTSNKVAITSSLGGRTVDTDGIHFPAKAGYKQTSLKFSFGGEFDSISFDYNIVSYCGSGGTDNVFVYNFDGTKQITAFSSPTGTIKLTKEQCGNGVTLIIWIGCAGDWGQCIATPPHSDELLKIDNIKFYNDAVGEFTTLKMIGNNPLVTPSGYAEYQSFDSLLGVSELTAQGLSVADNTSLVAIIKDENGTQKGSYTATYTNGQAVFAISDYNYDGKVKVFLQTDAGEELSAQNLVAKVTRSLHLGKLFATQGTAGGWKATKLYGGLNINQDGIIYNDETRYYSANWPTEQSNPARYGFDYSFEWLGDMADLQSFTIDYKINKVCNCGGGDMFYIYNGSALAGSHSCQDWGSGQTYTTTVSIDKAKIDSYSSNTFNLFYWMGCSSNAHYNEQMEFGTMTYTYLLLGVQSFEVVA